MFFPLLKRKKKALPRGHVVVHLDDKSGHILDAEVLSALEDHEVGPVLDQTLSALNPLTEPARHARVEEMIKAASKKLGMLDKLARRASKWETQARAVVPRERFVGAAAEGFVEITVDGMLAVDGVEVKAGARSASAFALAQDALDDAAKQVASRWEACLEGALDVDASEEGEPLTDPVDSAPAEE